MAINYHGAKWGDPQFGTPGGRVEWRFGDAAAGLAPDAPSAFAATYAQEIRVAFDFWEDVTGIDFVEVSAALADVSIGWSAIDGAFGTLGVASWSFFRYETGNQIVEASVRFDRDEPWDVDGGPIDFLAVAIHEVGHILGLGHSDDPNSIMFPFLGDDTVPIAEDFAAAREIYGVGSFHLPPAEANDIFRFYNTETGTHFYTASPAERDAVADTLVGFLYEGNSFDRVEGAAADLEVFRFFNTETGTHFYTSSLAERDDVDARLDQYRFEGAAYRAASHDNGGEFVALHRFYHAESGTHFYTASEAERANVVGTLPQYSYEGVAYYVDTA